MVENDKNHGFMLCENSLTEHLVQALNDLLDDPQGEYFIDDSQYTDIALSMINSIITESQYVLPIGYLGLRNDIVFLFDSFGSVVLTFVTLWPILCRQSCQNHPFVMISLNVSKLVSRLPC
jgi:hypothetical protein